MLLYDVITRFPGFQTNSAVETPDTVRVSCTHGDRMVMNTCHGVCKLVFVILSPRYCNNLFRPTEYGATSELRRHIGRYIKLQLRLWFKASFFVYGLIVLKSIWHPPSYGNTTLTTESKRNGFSQLNFRTTKSIAVAFTIDALQSSNWSTRLSFSQASIIIVHLNMRAKISVLLCLMAGSVQ